MDITTITILAIVLYFLTLIYMGYQDHKKDNLNDFIIGDRKVGAIATMSSVAASFRDGGGATFWIGAGFAYGYGYTTFVFGFILGLFLLAMIAPKLREEAIKNNYITIGQMIKYRIGDKTAKTLSLLILIFIGLGVATQLYVLGNALSSILNIQVYITVFITAFVVGLYLLLGGYKTVVKTDVLQFFIILLLFIAIFFIPLNSQDLLNYKSVNVGLEANLIFFIWGFVISLSSGDNYQRIFSAKDNKSVKVGVALAGPFLALITFILISFGLSGRQFLDSSATGNDVLFSLLGQSSIFDSWIVVLLSVSIIAMTMSTLDTYTYLFSSTLLEDFGKISITKNKKRYVNISRICIVLLLILGSLASLFIEDFMQYFLSVAAYILIFAPVMFITSLNILEKSKKLDIYLSLSLTISSLVFLYLVFTGLINGLSYKLVPFYVCFGLILAACLIFRKKGK